MLLFLLACQDPKTELKDTAELATDVIDTAETDDTDDTIETGETQETGETDDTSEDTETGDTEPDEDTVTPITGGPVFTFVREEQVGGTNIWSKLVTIEDDFLFSTIADRVSPFEDMI